MIEFSSGSGRKQTSMLSYLKRYRLRIIGSLLITALFQLHILGWFPITVIEELENITYDARLTFTMPSTVDRRIVIVDVDETSLRKEGHWPWSREKLAELTERLFNEYRIAILGFDMVFAEKDTSFELDSLRTLLKKNDDQVLLSRVDELQQQFNKDNLFARSIGNKPVVLGYYFDTDPKKVLSTGQLPPPTFEKDGFMINTINAVEGSSYGANIPALQESAAAAGFFSNPLIDIDGVIRRVPLLHEFEGNMYESLALAIVRMVTGSIIVPEFSADTDTQGFPTMTHIDISGQLIPLDNQAAIHIPYRGAEGSYPYIPAADVLNNDVVNPDWLRGAIVLVGTTAIGLVDHRPTPTQGVFPGVEIHANIVSALLDGNVLSSPKNSVAIEFLLSVCLGIFLSLTIPFWSPIFTTVLFIFLEGAVITGSLWYWDYHHLVVPVAAISLMFLTLYIYNLAYGYFIEARTQRRLRHAFGSYLAPELVRSLADDADSSLLQGRTRDMTYLFTDLENFTRTSELLPADQLVTLLSEYLDGMCQIIIEEGGLLDKFVGDSIVAVYNAPLDQPDHAERAIKTAIKLDQYAEAFHSNSQAKGFGFGRTRIGINTGPAVIGNVGGKHRFEYTAIGDNVNVAARFENANKTLGTRICISDSTAQASNEQACRPVGCLLLPGKSEGIDAFEPVFSDDRRYPPLDQYLECYDIIRASKPAALPLVQELCKNYPQDTVSALFLQRLENNINGVDIKISK